MEQECQALPLPLQHAFLMSIPLPSSGTQCLGSQGPSECLGSDSAVISLFPSFQKVVDQWIYYLISFPSFLLSFKKQTSKPL